MCQKAMNESGPCQTLRELRFAGGRLVQCLGCGSIGVELGTTYLTFSEQEFYNFARWIEGVRWGEEHVESGRIRIRMREDATMMLSLAHQELRSAQALFGEGVRWLGSSGQILDSPPKTSFPLAETVH